MSAADHKRDAQKNVLLSICWLLTFDKAVSDMHSNPPNLTKVAQHMRESSFKHVLYADTIISSAHAACAFQDNNILKAEHSA